MKSFSRLAGVIAIALALSACSAVQDAAGWFNSTFSNGSAPQANSVAAAEGFYTAADNSLSAAINQDILPTSTVKNLGDLDNQVYAALVPLRQAAQAGNNVAIPALLAAYNAAYGKLYNAASASGVTLAVPTQPVNTGGTQ